MKDYKVNITEQRQTLRQMQNWKAAGIDGIQNFWYKKMYSIHQKLCGLINEVLEKPELMPEYLPRGRTYLLPKGGYSKNPAKYCPIACLCTLYKIITDCITKKIYISPL